MYSLPTSNVERSQAETVARGEREEQRASDRFVEESPLADRHEDAGSFADIDRALYESGCADPVAYMEFKARTNTLNGYAMTRFPYRKIESAKDLIRDEGVPVYVVLKFADAWTLHVVDETRDYPRIDRQFTWNDGAGDRTAERQRPTEIPVTDLTRLPIRDGCLSEEELANRTV